MSTPPPITVRTDAGPLTLPGGSTLADAVAQILAGADEATRPIATAVNGEFVPRAARAQHLLADGDTVLCFQAITGG